MPAKIAQISPWIVFGMPEVTVAVRTSLLSCRKAGKPPVFTPVRESSGKSRPIRVISMSLNLVLDYENSALAAPQSFRNGMQAAANILDSLIAAILRLLFLSDMAIGITTQTPASELARKVAT
jgi:hypothetical protein